MPPPNADDPLRTTDHALAPLPETPNATVTLQPLQGGPRDGPSVAPSEPPPPSLPGYEIEGVLGRGGMGVVYRARHLALKRTVALKMVLAGGHAGPRELARFRIEAEAVARLAHPNIVQIHEVGEAGGHPYFALEFVEGGNLAGKLGGHPLPAREAARLVETLARAMQLAHSRNVVHRDLKPANVLLAADGTPRITDFGLARQLDSDSGETQAGAVLGTPSYMAPEQASGRGHEAGPAADVYALGAILYDCLAGRPPFQGKTVVETLDQVRTQEPVPPSRWQASVPLDLDTICLKCLRKEPENRYASAAELADELGRFLRGEPVQARPVGRLERGWRWCKRYPALAAAVATVVGVLVLASVVSTLFGIDAGNKEAAAVAARNELATKNIELEQSQEIIVKKNTELEQSQDQLEGALARTWLSPLAEAPGPLTDAEIGAFTELAAFGNERLADRFLTEALRTPPGMRKLRTRAVFALHAVVGLDAQKRQDAERRLVRALEEPDLPDDARTDLALAASELEGWSTPAAAVVARALLQALKKTNDPRTLGSLAQGLSAVAGRLEPREVAETAATLSRAMTNTNEPLALGSLAQGLSAVAGRLEPREAAEAATTLTQAMTRNNDFQAFFPLAQGLSMVAARMEPREAAAMLTQAMTHTQNPQAVQALAQGLSAVAARMEAKEAAALLTQAMTRNDDFQAFFPLAQGLSMVAARMEPREAAALLTQAMTHTQNPNALEILAQGLSAVAARMEPTEGTRVSAEAAATLTKAMTRTNDANNLWALAQGLSAVAARMEPKEAARLSAEAAAALTQVMTRTNDDYALSSLAQALSAVLGDGRRLERARAVAATVGYLHASQGLPGALALLRPAAEPFPRRLSDQELVELLKRPLHLGPARRAILDHLEYRHQRPFATQWDFVRFAEEQKLGLDFTRRPQRP
jgi:hypothetical protein